MMPASLSSAHRLIPAAALLGSLACLAMLLFGFADLKPAVHRLDPTKITRYSPGTQVLQYPLGGLVPGLPLDAVSKVLDAPIALFENGRPLAHYPTSYELIGPEANGRYSAIDSRVIFSPSAAVADAPAEAVYELRVTPRPSGFVRTGLIVAASALMVIAIWKLATGYGLALAIATSGLVTAFVIGFSMPTTSATIGADAVRFYASGTLFADLVSGLGTELKTNMKTMRFRGGLPSGADLPATDCSAGRSGTTVDFSAGCNKYFAAGETASIPAELAFGMVTRIAIVASVLLGLLIASTFRALASQRRFAWLFSEASHRPVTGTIVLRSTVPIVAALVAIGAVAPYPALQQTSQPSSFADAGLPNRLAYYAEHAAEFNLVFFGDSRTFTDVHPHLVDAYLGTNSINLGQFSNWFPTQRAFVRDLHKLVSPPTTVVWSVGRQNFFPGGLVQRVYPISLAEAVRYRLIGVNEGGLFDNVFYYSPVLHVLTSRSEWRDNVFRVLARPASLPELVRSASAAEAPAILELEKLNELCNAAPSVKNDTAVLVRTGQSLKFAGHVNVTEEGNRVTSLVIWTNRGSYLRIELDPAYFREKQRGSGSTSALVIPPPHPPHMTLFREMLDDFAARGVRLIVNEVEEAPQTYADQPARDADRTFMDRYVRPEVEKRGFPYVRIDWNAFEPDDYFDYNHLNSKGAAKFTPMLAAALQKFAR